MDGRKRNHKLLYASGQKMAPSAVYDAIASGNGALLTSSNTSQQAGADIVNQTPQFDAAIAVVTALGTRGRDVLRDPKDFVDDLKKLKGKNNKKKKDSDKDDGGKIKGDDNQNKCKSKQGEKQKCKPGVYAGGRHGSVGPGGHGCTPKRESHHMPANSTYEKLNGGKVSDANKPAIQVDLADHEQTSSYKYSKNSIEYRGKQALLIKAGMYKQAMQMDIDEINDLFPGKYDEAIEEMKKWAKCMKYI